MFMCFSTPFVIDSPYGILNGNTGDFIINRPYNQFWHTNTENAKTGFVNSWCHFETGGDLSGFLANYDLFPDKIYHAADDGIFKNNLIEIENELNYFNSEKYYFDDMMALLVNKMIIGLSRQTKIHKMHNNFIIDKRINDMIKLRDNMLENYAEQYTIDALAKEVYISSDYFSALYKQIFKISPMKDLSLKRLSIAKKLLISTDMPIKIIAESCGYTDSNYFSRLFKKNTGFSPLDYRK